MQKWEYCLAKYHKDNEVWVFAPSRGKTLKHSDSLGNILKRLGIEGWEAVNYNVTNLIYDSSQKKWPSAQSSMTNRNLNVAREFLFKRPIEE